jgi:hypothetical protein
MRVGEQIYRVYKSDLLDPFPMYTLNGQVFGFFGKQLEAHGH